MYLSEALVGEPVGLAPESDRHCAVYFGPMKLCLIDHKTDQLVKIAPEWLPELILMSPALQRHSEPVEG